jgi:hypothetical protein
LADDQGARCPVVVKRDFILRFRKAVFSGIVVSCMVGLARGASGAVTVLNNAGIGVGFAIEDNFLGTAFSTGSAASAISSFSLPAYTNGPPYVLTNPELEFESMNTDGTVGTTLYTISGASNWSYDSNVLTFTAPSVFDFAPNTGYWAVFSDSGTVEGGDFWYTASSTSYAAQLGFSIPSSDSVFASTEDNTVAGPGGAYYSRAQYPLIYTLSINSVPEPVVLPVLGLIGFALASKRRIQRL